MAAGSRDKQQKTEEFHFDNEERKTRDEMQKTQGEALLKATGGPKKKKKKSKGGAQAEDSPGTDVEVDEIGTIHLIESLDPESKKILNSLVQSVLLTQQENDKDKLQLLSHKRQIVHAEQKLEKDKLEYQKQKIELMKLAT